MSSSIHLSELDEGIEKSIENAARYLKDALFLYQHKRYQSSILLSMLSYEGSGKALLIMDYKTKKKEVTKTQWTRRFCSHTVKNLASQRVIWRDADFIPDILDLDKALSKFKQDWKNVFTYVDYDFENRKWTSPLKPQSFGITSEESFCISAMTQASKALESVLKVCKK